LKDQVSNLRQTVEGLNSCFVDLIDDLTVAGSLEADSDSAEAIKKSIEKFLSLIKASQAWETELEDGTFAAIASEASTTAGMACNSTESSAIDLASSTSPVDSSHQVMFQQPNESFQPMSPDSLVEDDQLSREIVPVTPRAWRAVADSLGQQRYSTLGTNSPFPIFKSMAPQHNIERFSNLGLRLLATQSLSFAQRLQITAYQTALRVVLTSDVQVEVFQRAFNTLPSPRVVSKLKEFYTKVLNENFQNLLFPPTPDFPNLAGTGAEPSGWLNASQVEAYFRRRGLDLDDSPVSRNASKTVRHSRTAEAMKVSQMGWETALQVRTYLSILPIIGTDNVIGGFKWSGERSCAVGTAAVCFLW
jgi:hypothetical protein